MQSKLHHITLLEDIKYDIKEGSNMLLCCKRRLKSCAATLLEQYRSTHIVIL